jgi:hypothetical protein
MILHQPPHGGDCARGRARSVAPLNLPELPNAPAQADSRRYRKDQRHFETITPKAMPSSSQRRSHCLDDY